MRSFFLRLAYVTFLIGILAGWSRPDIATIVGSSRAGVVKLRIQNDNGYENSGSGFVVMASGYVLTAAHLLPSSTENLKIWGRLGNQRVTKENPAREIGLDLINYDVGLDVALLKFKSLPEGIRPLPINPFVPKAGARLYVLGFAGGQDLMTRDDVVAQADYPYIDGPDNFFEYHGVANQGNSGGPLLDEDGSVVGIVSRDVKSIRGVDVSGIHLAVRSDNFILPDDFSGPNIRPIYFPARGLLKFRLKDLTPEDWDRTRDKYLIDQFSSSEPQKICDIMFGGDGWKLFKHSKGFVVQSEGSEVFAETGLAFSTTIISRSEKSNVYNDDENFIIPPFAAMPSANQSFVFQDAQEVDGSIDQENAPFVFLESGGRYVLAQYFTRFSGTSDIGVKGGNTVVAVCSAKKDGISGAAFFPICEKLMGQFIKSYPSNGNQCIPGDRLGAK